MPFFQQNRLRISKIAARRSRSLAVTQFNDVYEWGFLGSDVDQEGACSEIDQFRKLYLLPGKCKAVEIGLEFNLFLLENGAVYLGGLISQEGIAIVNTGTSLQVMNQGSVTFKRIAAGYGHALLVDEDD